MMNTKRDSVFVNIEKKKKPHKRKKCENIEVL